MMINVFQFDIEDYENNTNIRKCGNNIFIKNILFELKKIDKKEDIYSKEAIYTYESEKTNIKLIEKIHKETDETIKELWIYFNFFDIEKPYRATFMDKYKLTLSELEQLVKNLLPNNIPNIKKLNEEITQELNNIEKINSLLIYWKKISGLDWMPVWDYKSYLEHKDKLVQFSDFYFGKTNNENNVINVSNLCVVKNLDKISVDKIIIDIKINHECQIENTYTIYGKFKHPVFVKFENVKLLKIEEINNSYNLFLVPHSGLQFTIKTILNRDKYNFETGEIIETPSQ